MDALGIHEQELERVGKEHVSDIEAGKHLVGKETTSVFCTDSYEDGKLTI